MSRISRNQLSGKNPRKMKKCSSLKSDFTTRLLFNIRYRRKWKHYLSFLKSLSRGTREITMHKMPSALDSYAKVTKRESVNYSHKLVTSTR